MQVCKYALSVLILTLALFALPSRVVFAGEDMEDELDETGTFGFVNATLAPDARHSDAAGFLVTAGDEITSGVELRCFNEENNFTFYCAAEHPDSARVKSNSSTVEQSKKGNSVIVGIRGTVATVVDTDIVCSCDKAQHKGKADTRKLGRLTLKCKFKKCDCTSGLSFEQARAVEACFENSRTKTLKVEQGKDGKLDGTLEGKGRMGAPPSS